ncbi:RluA family pseudouridine synthase [Mesoterricola silvestris]|uniref:RluA family pseudouridine synthase n=1 Tax=Mesoterricola silvestris TaxID=2927979 RepID=UPI00292D574B|nr:RluA family pseudouridine synthase [Mesoterricola silvestris]
MDPAEEGMRLDQLVSAHTGLSRRKAREVLQLGGVQAHRKRIKVASKLLKPGTEVSVSVDDALGQPLDMAVPVLFEDEFLLVVDKPAGMASQGTQASDLHDLTALLQRQRPGQFLALQHRLDQGTSGILVIAKHPSAHLGTQFQARTIAKTYLARVSRHLEPCTVDLPIGRVRNSRPARFGCTGDLLDPRPSVTDFRPALPEETGGFLPGFWVVATPHTGRTHQIRVHLSHLGAPVYGDALYFGEKSDHLWLHAWKLSIEHPITGVPMELVAPPARFMGDPA